VHISTSKPNPKILNSNQAEKNDFLSRDRMIKRIQERIEDIIKEDEKNDGKKHMYEYWINGGGENETI